MLKVLEHWKGHSPFSLISLLIQENFTISLGSVSKGLSAFSHPVNPGKYRLFYLGSKGLPGILWFRTPRIQDPHTYIDLIRQWCLPASA